jgi:hypothetical protein
VRAGALNGRIECTMAWQDPETGVWLRARPDLIPTDSGDFVDLKTSESVTYDHLVYAIGEYGYHQQGALIWEVCELLGMPFDGFALIFVEKKSPYCVRVIELPDEDLARGRQQNRAMIRQVKKCMDDGP